MSEPIHQNSRARAMVQKLEAIFKSVAGAREAFPELATLEQGLRTRGLPALDDLPELDRADVTRRLRALLPGHGLAQLEAIAKLLTSFDLRSPERRRNAANLMSTPAMFAAELPMDEFAQMFATTGTGTGTGGDTLTRF